MEKRKRSCAILMIAAVMTGVFGAISDDIVAHAEEENVFSEMNSGFNDAGEDNVPYWWYGSGAEISIENDETAPEGERCVKVEPQSEGKWVGCAINATNVLEDGVTYEYSFYARLDENGSESEPVEVRPVINRIYTEDYSDTDQDTRVDQEEVYLSGNQWTKVTGTFTVDKNPFGGKEAVMLHFIINSSSTDTFYIDNLSVSKTEKDLVEIEDIMPLKDHFAEKSTIGGRAGVAIPVGALSDEARMELVTKHYNSITCENEMKPEVILGSTPSYQTETDGTIVYDENGDPILQLDFSQADAIMDYVKDYNENNPDDIIRVRGHVLVWHSQTPDWFFREGYSTDGEYVSKEKMLVRMENYIKEVIEHYDSDTSPYQGIIYAWDVVNEQIETADYDAENNPNSFRFTCNGTTTGWYNVFQGDSSYITQAFVYANKYAPEDVKLFYNDYGETEPAKRDAICNLLSMIRNTDGARIDGMGMQAHYSMDSPSVSLIEEAVKKYSAVVDEVQLTELDMQSSKNYDGSDRDVELTKEGYRYKEIFEVLCGLDKEPGIDITAITIWGTHDGASWLQSSSDVGGGADGNRPQMPLLFDDEYKAKPAYWGIVDSSKLEPLINKISIRYSESDDFENIDPVIYQSYVGEISFRALWNESGIKIMVNVPDREKDDLDRVVIYAESPENVFTVYREDVEETENGYRAIVTIPAEKLQPLTVGTVIALDVVVFDNDIQMSWNDLTNAQASDNKYYGEFVCKPYIEVTRGTPEIDGIFEEEWINTEQVPLTITTGSPKASGTVRAMWDDEYLYAYFQVSDPEVSKMGLNAHEQDSVEVFVDQNNEKSEIYQEDDSQYRINFENEASFNGVNCTAANLRSAAVRTETGYNVELGIKWIGVGPKVGDFLGLEFQINDGASDGSRIGTVSWYDESGMGYQRPSVFGTVKLIESQENQEVDDNKTGNESENGNTDKKPEIIENGDAVADNNVKKKNDSVAEQKRGSVSAVQTGDETDITQYLVILTTAIICIALIRKKQRKHDLRR